MVNTVSGLVMQHYNIDSNGKTELSLKMHTLE
uniref:Uncharacterized protein n=1 Tax=Arundo donax TaxID=35708 RepID=A0A0A9CHI6_ARUDO